MSTGFEMQDDRYIAGSQASQGEEVRFIHAASPHKLTNLALREVLFATAPKILSTPSRL